MRHFGIAVLFALGSNIQQIAELPNYTIPLIDLAFEESRQTIVDQQDGQYLGHPTCVLLDDGKTLIAVYPKGHGKGAIIMKRSTDGGLTWSDRLPTPETWNTSKETPTIHHMNTTQGKGLVLFSGLYPIRRALSADDGVTWTELEAIGDFGGIVAMASVERLRDDRYVAFFHDDGRFIGQDEVKAEPPQFTVYQTFSKDGGVHWCEPETVVTHKSAHLCEPGLIRSPDGKQLALLLRENSRRHNSFVVFSDDECETWSSPRELPAAMTGDRHQGVYTDDGRLYISFRDTTRESPTKGDWVAWVGTYDDIVSGGQGEMRIRLMDNHHRWDCAYPAVLKLPDGTIVTMTYGHWTLGKPPYIASVRLKPEELDARMKLNLERLLEVIRKDWSWTIEDAKRILLTSKFGNVIVEDARGRIFRICPEELECTLLAEDPEKDPQAWNRISNDPEFLEDWRMEPLVKASEGRFGIQPQSRCFCLKLPGVFGGEYAIENVGTVTIEELLSISGVMAKQILDVPDGGAVKVEWNPSQFDKKSP